MNCGNPVPRSSLALAFCLSLAACGGGGGVNSTPSPTPSPTPAPAPTPTPTSINFDTPEYRNSSGAVQHGAITAWQNGASGQGVTVGVIDTGIDTSSAEFSGRISKDSRAFGGNSNYRDEDGHGTAVTGILAAARNNAEIMGVAYNATIMALRADRAGSCGEEDGCDFFNSDIAAALDQATRNGARVVNMSLGGSAPDATLRAAIDRATAAGVILVISAGNESAAQPGDFAMIATDPLARGLVIIAGSVNGAGTISSFSNQATGAEGVYIAALGEEVRSLDLKNDPGSYYLFSGTSFSTPQVAGAAALLAQAFPNLTSAQIVRLLLDNASDAGATGTDSVYGRGILNIAAAFAPQGTTSLAGSSTPVSTGDSSSLSAPMGDAASTASAAAVLLDSYGRAYRLDFGGTLRSDLPSLALTPALRADEQHFSVRRGNTRIAMTIAQGPNGGASVTPLTLSSAEAGRARAQAGYIASRIGERTDFAIGFSQGSGSLSAMVRGSDAPAFLIASSPARSAGFRQDGESSFALRWRFGDGFGLTVTGESGDALVRSQWEDRLRGRYRREPYSALTIGLDAASGPARLNLSATQMVEDRTVLGARFRPLLGAGSARSLFLDTGLELRPGHGWGLGAAWRQGWTWAAAGGQLRQGATLRTSAYAFDLWKDGLLDTTDRLALRISQPLRVDSGALALTLPVSYDYGTGAAAYGVEYLNLAPRGRQTDLEAAYSRALDWGDVSANLFYRKDPGNIAGYPDDAGIALRFTSRF